jgi:hypothetical protein
VTGGPPQPERRFVALLLPARDPAHLSRMVAAAPWADCCPPQAPGAGWPRPVRWRNTIDGQAVAWCGDRRRVADLPDDPNALLLVARLGCVDLADRIALRGDLLLAGIRPDGAPADVPPPVLQAASRAGLLHEETPQVALGAAQPTAAGPRTSAGRR